MHSSVRHTFRTIGDIPLGKIENGEITYFKNDIRRKSAIDKNILTTAAPKIESKVGMLYMHPGFGPDVVDHYIDKGYKGLIIVGTGLGHGPHAIFNSLKRAQEQGITMVMALQTLWGFTGMDVYETGRELQEFGVIPGQNMLPEVAFAKLCWVLGNYSNPQEIKKIMMTNVAGEITDGEPDNGFLVKQGIE
jgi:glutamyl-tRNA(Gln) amidotransferase subunit D